MKTYDAFLFFNELDLLDIRLNIMAPYVDYFVISEATITFSGKPKPLYFLENKERYLEFKNKIIHVIVDDTPTIGDQWDREIFQRECLLRGLESCNSNDMVISSDLDEIPNPTILEKCKKSLANGIIYTPEQKMYYYYLNFLIKDKIWLGSKICRYETIKKESVRSVRDTKTGVHIKNNGWHFSFMGGIDLIIQKIEAFSHQEYNTDNVKDNLETRISENKDILCAHNLEFITVPIDDSYPEYIRNNQDKYPNLIKFYE
jgi:beta-1,4-mannosyl-glycoprotein beta-1,4-N-acetylglucosaminyltransferase